MQEKIDCCRQSIADLPELEIKYYLNLLINSIDKNKFKKKEKMEKFIDELTNFTQLFNEIIRNPEDKDIDFAELFKQYEILKKIAKTHTIGTNIYYTLLQVGAAVSAFIMGMTGGLIGGVAGFARGVWNIFNLQNPIAHVGIGIFTGFMIGSAIGFRAPKKLLKNELTRQLRFGMNGVKECIKNYREQEPITDEFIINKYFDNNKASFDEFLNNNAVKFDVITIKARFIASDKLENYLGHHSLIKVHLPNDKYHQLELTSQSSDLDEREQSQKETRTASARTIIDMLKLHEQLQKTHTSSTYYSIFKMKAGDNDCFSYVNRILLGTNQAATKLQRYQGENWIGRNFIGFFMRNLSPFSQTIFEENAPEQPNLV